MLMQIDLYEEWGHGLQHRSQLEYIYNSWTIYTETVHHIVHEYEYSWIFSREVAQTPKGTEHTLEIEQYVRITFTVTVKSVTAVVAAVFPFRV